MFTAGRNVNNVGKHTNSRFNVLCCSSLHASVLLWGPAVVSTPFLFHVLG